MAEISKFILGLLLVVISSFCSGHCQCLPVHVDWWALVHNSARQSTWTGGH
jgi:hypothetical protein